MTDSRVKLLISYDIVPELQQAYYEFVLGEFIPSAQSLGLVLSEAWHTAYGDYPVRLNGFVARDKPSLDRILSGSEWRQLEDKLKRFVTMYDKRIVAFREGFQF
jgi:hypothetical protein